MPSRSASHGEAFRDLSMIERTVLDFLESLSDGADPDVRQAINVVEEAIFDA